MQYDFMRYKTRCLLGRREEGNSLETSIRFKEVSHPLSGTAPGLWDVRVTTGQELRGSCLLSSEPCFCKGISGEENCGYASDWFDYNYEWILKPSIMFIC